MAARKHVVVIGAGPVGALAALYAAQRGDNVDVYELRGDLRLPGTVPLNFTKSINLALSERGINAMRCANRPGLVENIMKETIPMYARMIHGRSPSGELYEESQIYDVNGRAIYAVDRGGLNKRLLDELEAMPNVKFHFNHKLVGADFKANKAWFEQHASPRDKNSRHREIEVDFDFMIGADGAHSAVRYHLMKYQRMDYMQEYIDTLWCEFEIDPLAGKGVAGGDSVFAISQHHLHIWPGKDYMFIAIPSLDGSFTCTLFLPSRHFTALESDPASLPTFFDEHFPGVTDLIPKEKLLHSFTNNAHLPLISIKCQPYHYSHSCVIVGDAAHAMVPFYGQGMNAGLEDIHTLFSIIDKHHHTTSPSASLTTSSSPPPTSPSSSPLAAALAEYSTHRAPDAAAINDLALQNYVEMRASVVSRTYQVRKYLEEQLSVWVPRLGWQTKYSRVSFGNERYSDIVRKSERQGVLLWRGLLGGLAIPVIGVGVMLLWRWRVAHEPTRLATKLQALMWWKTT